MLQDDYLALVLSGGYPTLMVDLGERQTSIIAVQIKIIPHEWYNVKIARLETIRHFKYYAIRL